MKSAHPKQKCELCEKELEFHIPTVRRKKKWYHAKCYKSIIEEKTIIEEEGIETKPIVKATIIEPAKEIEKIKPEAIQKPPAQKVTEPGKKTEPTIVKKEPKISPKATSESIPLAKPEPTQKKTKELQKIDTKRVADFEKQVSLPKIRHDPLLIFISGVIFIFLFSAAYLLLAGFSVAAMFLGGFLVMYQLLDARRSSKSEFRHGKHAPAVFPLFLLILPFVLGGVLAYEGYTAWESAFRAVILWGLTIIFWSVMLMVPLSVYSKNKEELIPSPLRYPIVSIIIPAYNEEKVIAKTIESLLEVDYPKKEIIVIDDGSRDNTLQVAKRYERDNVKVLHKENGGKATALNYGLAFAKGEIITVLDADTIAGKNSLKEIAKIFEDDKNIAAVAGNIKVRNKVNWLTWCQALEYVAGIQIARRAFDLFGAITIVPGALGSFRKSVLQETGSYDKETLVEDFDTTIKVLKSGMVVRGTTKSIAYTEAPESLADFYKQRKRWYRGNLQVLMKHRNALTNPRFGFLQKLAFPYLVLSMIVLPATGFVVLGSAILALIEGDVIFVLTSFSFFIILQYLLTALGVRIDGDDPKLILFAIFFNLGYKQILDFILLRQALEQLFKKETRWTRAKRIGFDEH